ncbi:MAG: PQQ-dependent sugar dehydrogenase [Anaerolineales bacterium]
MTKQNPPTMLKAVRNCGLLALGAVGLLLIIGLGVAAYVVLTAPEAATSDLIRFEEVADGMTEPNGLAHVNDERLFVHERQGRIWVIDAQGTRLEPAFLDIRDQVRSSDHNEQGLLGLAFAPDYAENGYFFIHYTALDDDDQLWSRVTRWQVSADDPNRADPASETLVLEYPQPGNTHNAGQLAFGPDGYLYIGTGDGGQLGRQDLQTGQIRSDLLGAILRIDVSTLPYQIPPDNPFVDEPDARPEIWLYGLRNPWRFSFDTATGDLYIGDVGAGAWEEVNYVPAGSPGGLNFGWSIYEGSQENRLAADHPQRPPREALTFAVAEYARNFDNPGQIVSEGGHRCAVIGGYVYRGAAIPELDGSYLYADWCSGLVWRLTREGDTWQNAPFMDTDHTISSWGQGPDGELYIVNYRDGALWRMMPR